MEAFQVPLNYSAVAVGAAINFLLGWVWFGPVLGKLWVRLGGGELRPDPLSLGIGFLTALAVSYVLALAVSVTFAALHVAGVVAGLGVAVVAWLGFIAPITLGPVIYERKSFKLFLLNNAYWLTSLLLMGALFALWI